MNKYTKNQIWFNLEKIITFTVITGMLILTIACATSCATSKSYKATSNIDCKVFQKSKYDVQTGLYSK